MGGFGSTRWNGKQVRATTESLEALTVAALRPFFGNQTNALFVEWAGTGTQIELFVSQKHVVLDYAYRVGEGELRPVRETVVVSRTPCTYGGSRAWLVCPGCQTRRRALYLAPGTLRFRCRRCHGLQYEIQRMKPLDRHMHRALVLQRRLDGCEGGNIRQIALKKPKGMHRTTYRRILCMIDEHEIAWAEIIIAYFGAISPPLPPTNRE